MFWSRDIPVLIAARLSGSDWSVCQLNIYSTGPAEDTGHHGRDCKDVNAEGAEIAEGAE